MSWEQLEAIIEENKQSLQDSQEIKSCPVCGQLLDVNSQGVKNCPMGHWRK